MVVIVLVVVTVSDILFLILTVTVAVTFQEDLVRTLSHRTRGEGNDPDYLPHIA